MTTCKRHWYPKDGPRICKRCGLDANEEFPHSAEPPPPEHSPLGASSAERWMNCSGSVYLSKVIREINAFYEGDTEYRTAGVMAHKVAAHCLNNDIDAWQLVSLSGWP